MFGIVPSHPCSKSRVPTASYRKIIVCSQPIHYSDRLCCSAGGPKVWAQGLWSSCEDQAFSSAALEGPNSRSMSSRLIVNDAQQVPGYA